MTATHLHTYRCSFCKTVATTTVRARSQDIKCSLCRRFMAYMASTPIETDEQRALASRGGTVYTYFGDNQGRTLRRCDECHALVERDSMIHLGQFLRFCSPKCADIGTERHRIELEAVRERLESLYQRMPWLRPNRKKESA